MIEEAVKRHLGLDVLERLWERNDMDDDAMALAVEAQKAARRKSRPRRRR